MFLVYCANGLDGISINVGHGSRSAPLPHLLINRLGLPFPPGNISHQTQAQCLTSGYTRQMTRDQANEGEALLSLNAYPGLSSASCQKSWDVTVLVFMCMIMSLPRSMMVSALTRLRGKDNIGDTSPASADQKRSVSR